MSKEYHPQIMTGLSVQIAGVILAAVIDEEAKTVRIEQRGPSMNGSAPAIAEGRRQLLGRIKRTRPDLTILQS